MPRRCTLSTPNFRKKSVFDDLLEKMGLNYTDFSKQLGLGNIKVLWQYRTGKRPFRLSMEQIHTLEQMLEPLGMRLNDLPPDWIKDKT